MRRRDLASIFLTAVPVAAQTTAASAPDDLTAARERVRAAGAELASSRAAAKTRSGWRRITGALWFKEARARAQLRKLVHYTGL